MKKKKLYSTLFVITYKGYILTPDVFVEFWPNYGAAGSTLQGWRPPKKVYYTESGARNGLRYVPKIIQSKCQIEEFGPLSIVNKCLK